MNGRLEVHGSTERVSLNAVERIGGPGSPLAPPVTGDRSRHEFRRFLPSLFSKLPQASTKSTLFTHFRSIN